VGNVSKPSGKKPFSDKLSMTSNSSARGFRAEINGASDAAPVASDMGRIGTGCSPSGIVASSTTTGRKTRSTGSQKTRRAGVFLSRLASVRRLRNLSQTELAARCGLGESTIRAYERGLRTPSLVVVMDFCEVLNATVEDLL
jgi:DNA-binding XRE family transcriptional regulator